MPDDTPAPPDLAAIRADCATLKPRERASTLTDAQERLLYEAVPALLAEVERLRAENRGLHYIVAGTRGYKAEAGDYPSPAESWRGMTLHITDPKPPRRGLAFRRPPVHDRREQRGQVTLT